MFFFLEISSFYLIFRSFFRSFLFWNLCDRSLLLGRMCVKFLNLYKFLIKNRVETFYITLCFFMI